METFPGKEVVKEEKFPHSRKLSHRGSVGSFGILEGNITGRKKQNKPNQPNKQTQNTRLTITAEKRTFLQKVIT